MKKYILIYVLSALFMHNTGFLNAQNPDNVAQFNRYKYEVIDTAVFQIVYTFDFIDDIDKKDIESNQLALLIGHKYSKFFNAQYLFYVKPKNIPASVDQLFDGKGLASTEVYKNNVDKDMLVTFKLIDGKDIYQYKEKFYLQHWDINNQHKEILGYDCVSATTSFRGRDYTAWFTTEIPISNGPWKFSGLPGLILEVADSENLFSFKCVSIKQLKEYQPIVKYEAKYVNIDRKKLNAYVFNMNKNFARYLSKYRLVKVVDKDGNELNKPPTVPDKRYNPIELE